jgi:hypothetical protein
MLARVHVEIMESNHIVLCTALISLLAFIVLTTIAGADIGPPLSPATVYITYNGTPIAGTFYSAMLYCTNSSSIDTYRLPVPQLNISEYDAAKGCYWIYDMFTYGGTCTDSFCNFTYSPDDLKMAVYLPALNKTFITNEINNTGLTKAYNVTLSPNGSATIRNVITPQPYPPGPDVLGTFFVALILTEIIDLIVAFIYLQVAKIKRKVRILGTVFLATIISLPVVWFALALQFGAPGLLLGEIFAVVFDGLLIYYLNKKSIKLLKSAMVMSVIINLASFIIGGAILLLL